MQQEPANSTLKEKCLKALEDTNQWCYAATSLTTFLDLTKKPEQYQRLTKNRKNRSKNGH